MSNFSNMFNGMFGPVQHGCCRLSMNGKIAIKTSNGYKTYNVKTGRLTNCSNFVFNIGEDLFFVIPTNKVQVGDIILVGGTPRCVISAKANEIVALNYENSTKETIIPERHVFMGKQYMYGKIVSMMGNMKGNGLMKYMMMSEVLKQMNGGKGNSFGMNGDNNGMGNMMSTMAVMSMFGGGNDIFNFDEMFDFGELEMPDDADDETATNDEEEE